MASFGVSNCVSPPPPPPPPLFFFGVDVHIHMQRCDDLCAPQTGARLLVNKQGINTDMEVDTNATPKTAKAAGGCEGTYMPVDSQKGTPLQLRAGTCLNSFYAACLILPEVFIIV